MICIMPRSGPLQKDFVFADDTRYNAIGPLLPAGDLLTIRH